MVDAAEAKAKKSPLDVILIALIALGALLFLAGASFGWILILVGIIALGLRKGSRSRTPGQRESRSPRPQRHRPRPRYEPYDPEEPEDEWDDDEWDSDDDEEWDDDDGEWDWDDLEAPSGGSRNRRRRSGGWETDDADYI